MNVDKAPSNVWKCYKNGGYEHYNAAAHDQFFKGRKIRFGAYGDPVAVPLPVWAHLAKIADGHTGYTHSWRIAKFWRFRRLIMASVEDLAGKEAANDLGWRTFRAMGPDEWLESDEAECGASEGQGNRLDCASCLACDGSRKISASRSPIVNFAIVVHGSPSTLGSYSRTMNGRQS